MPAPATFETFEPALRDLVARFAAGAAGFLSRQYDEASLRQDFLNPLFRALGWDLENSARLILKHREVEIESRTMVAGRKKRADYLFRTDTRDRFVCEAKKPSESLDSRHAFQAKRYGWNKEVPLSVLTDFEELCIYIVAARPAIDDPVEIGLWRKWHYSEYPAHAREIWDLLSRDAVAGGAIDRLLDTLPKKPSRQGRARQLWLIRPDRSRALDTDFLNFLDEARRTLGSDLLRHNPAAGLREDHARLNEAVQCILDRLLFLRICEDRDIDTGTNLHLEVENWRSATGRPSPSRARQSFLPAVCEEPPPPTGTPNLSTRLLWPRIVAHFRALDRRPASHVPYFNGHLFKPHFIEDLTVGDDWLATFLDDISNDESPYLFAVIPVEILGTIYERFLGNVIRPHGLGVTIEPKPEVRKAGGVYYTPRYIVDYIVEQTVGKLLDGQPPEKTTALRFLDPACGSGSFLIRVFERVCEHWLAWLTTNPKARKKTLCWTEEKTGDVHLTAALKRRILTSNIYGVDLDPGAVEVTQLSLYLKMLENENRNTLARERELFASEDEPALLPPLAANIKCGNSLIASDFSLDPDELVRVRAFDWDVQFAPIMQAGGFDAVVGNPPYLYSAGQDSIAYFQQCFRFSEYQTDFYTYFIEKALGLTRKHGRFSFVVSDSWLKAENFSKLRNHLLAEHHLVRLGVFTFAPFEGAVIENSILVLSKAGKPRPIPVDLFSEPGRYTQINEIDPKNAISRGLIDPQSSRIADALITKLEEESTPLDDFVEINRGIHAYRTDGYGKSKFSNGTQTKRDKDEQSYHATRRVDATFLPELKGKNVFRFDHVPTGNYIAYGDWLAEPREPKFFLNPKITLRKILGRKLHGTFLSKPTGLDQSLYVLISPDNDPAQLKFLLGILLSSIGAWYLRTKFAIYDALYPWYTRKQLGAFPIKGKSQKLVEFVDKMLVLTPKLRAATGDQERATLQNAIAATDNQIDQLVYELYDLTPEEKALVENATRA